VSLLVNKIVLKITFYVFDLFLILLSFLLAWKIRFFNDILWIDLIPKLSFFNDNIINLSFKNNIQDYIGFLLFVMSSWAILCYALDLLHIPRTTKRLQNSFWDYIFYPQIILVCILLLGIVFFNYDQIPRLFLFLFIFIQFSFLAISKKIRIKIFQYLRISGLDLVNLAFISSDTDIDQIKNWLSKNKNSGFKLKNLELDNLDTNSFDNLLQLINILDHDDYLILNQEHISKKEAIQIKEKAENKGIHIYRILSSKRYHFLRERNIKGLSTIGSFKLIKIRKTYIKNGINVINKRFFDFIFSLLFILFIYWWSYIIIFLIIKFQSKGPILFKQKRIGLDGQTFMCYKFRTMHIHESNSKTITKKDDSRIFAFGRLMRKLNIDEFPQFINVFKGDMSVVGPRPHMVSEDIMLADKIEKYRMRRWVKPGITGYAAIKGFRGGTESIELMQKRINLDVRYIEKWTFWLDLKICYQTIFEMISFKSKGH